MIMIIVGDEMKWKKIKYYKIRRMIFYQLFMYMMSVIYGLLFLQNFLIFLVGQLYVKLFVVV